MKFVKYKNVPVDGEMDSHPDLMRARVQAVLILVGVGIIVLLGMAIYVLI